MEWPAHYPTECPPRDAHQPNTELFRITQCSNPRSQDFLSFYEIDYKAVAAGKRDSMNPRLQNCEARGLSFFNSVEASAKMALKIPNLKKKKGLCTVYPDPLTDGLIKHTPSCNSRNHFTWWVPNGISLFSKSLCRSEEFKLKKEELKKLNAEGQ